MSSKFGHVVLANTSNAVFPNVSKNDLLIYTSSNQSILVGTSNSSNFLRVTSNLVQVVGNLDFSGALTNNGSPFVSGGGGVSGSNLAISGGLACGSINISANVVSSAIPVTAKASSLIIYSSSNNSNASTGINSNVDGTGLTVSLVASNTFMNIVYFNSNDSTTYEVMRITGKGNVGIGTNDPIYPLDIAGTARADSIMYTSLQQVSDRRVKSNIHSIDEAWADTMIASLEPVTFQFNKSPTTTNIGFIAQDVAAVCPLATRTTSDFVPFIGQATVSGTTMTCDLPFIPNDVFRTADGAVCTVHSVTSANTFEIDTTTIITSSSSSTSSSTSASTSANPIPIDITEILVGDFHSIDFNALLATAVASIKSLTKRVAVLEMESAMKMR